MQLLEDAIQLVNKYTTTDEWRPGIVDLLVYDIMIGMHESDYENGSTVPSYIWRDTPDHIMQHMIDKSRIFDLEFGLEDLDEQIRDYLIIENFIVDPLDESVSDEEYQTNLQKEI